jgi:hypothetical protein
MDKRRTTLLFALGVIACSKAKVSETGAEAGVDASVESWLPQAPSSGPVPSVVTTPCYTASAAPQIDEAQRAAKDGNVAKVRALLEKRVRDGHGTAGDARLVKEACKQMGDIACVNEVKAKYPDGIQPCPPPIPPPCVSVGSSPDLPKAKEAALRNDLKAVRKLLEDKVRSGGGTIEEARLVKEACKQMADTRCVTDIKSQYPDNREPCPNAPP